MEREQGFTADSEITESLKVEASTLTPEESQELKLLSASIKDEVMQRYGRFLSESTRERLKGIEERIIVTDRDSFEQFSQAWQPGPVRRGKEPIPPPWITATYIPKGQLIVLKDPKESWDLIGAEEQEELIRHYGDERAARKAAERMVLIDNVVHEVIHQCEDTELPTSFLELGTIYYQQPIMRKPGEAVMVPKGEEKRVAFYSHLVPKYGDAVHKLFFGTLIDPIQRAAILSELTPTVINKLFPREEGYSG